MLRWIPLRSQWQGDGEGGSCHAKEKAEQQGLFITVNAVEPGHEQRSDHHDLTEQPGGLGGGAVGQHAQHQAQHCTGKDGRGDHEGTLLGGEAEVGRNLHAKRAKHVPDHETQVEIEKSG